MFTSSHSVFWLFCLQTLVRALSVHAAKAASGTVTHTQSPQAGCGTRHISLPASQQYEKMANIVNRLLKGVFHFKSWTGTGRGLFSHASHLNILSIWLKNCMSALSFFILAFSHQTNQTIQPCLDPIICWDDFTLSRLNKCLTHAPSSLR